MKMAILVKDNAATVMKCLIFAFVTLSLSSCASMSGQVFKEIQNGDSSAHVREVLGDPDQFVPSPKVAGANFWIYHRRSDVCVITIYRDAVAESPLCQKDPSYISPAAAFFKGMGDSMSKNDQPAPRQLNCTSQVMGEFVNTQCN
jgi:hypothetical protein